MIPMALDRDMLATDLAGVLSENHGINVDSSDVQRGLDAFLKAIEPVKIPDALRRIGAFVEVYSDQTAGLHDEVAAIDNERLLVSDLRALVRGVEATFPTRSLREKLMARGSIPYPDGVTPLECPTCHGGATTFEGIVQRHLKPSGLPCTGAGQAVSIPGATGE
jgi:hypothetical protein